MSGATNPLRIIGIGSPFGGDVIGMQAIERLQAESFIEVLPVVPELIALDRPGSELVSYLEGAGAVVLIDAMSAGEPPATVLKLTVDELQRQAAAPSSHNLGVAEALALAAALGVLPVRVLIYGIELGDGVVPDTWYPSLCKQLQQELPELLDSLPSLSELQ